MLHQTKTNQSVLQIYQRSWCHCHTPTSQSPLTVLRGRLVKILAMFRVQHLIHVTHFCPNSYSVVLVLVFRRDVLLALDSSLNLSNDLRFHFRTNEIHINRYYRENKNEKTFFYFSLNGNNEISFAKGDRWRNKCRRLISLVQRPGMTYIHTFPSICVVSFIKIVMNISTKLLHKTKHIQVSNAASAIKMFSEEKI